MKFFPEITNNTPVNTREQAVVEFWKKKSVFAKSVKLTKTGPPFVFYEGPPTANGKPGIHHILSRVYKDIYIRFYTQQGYHVPRKAGWDCHGLPVEREVEKALGIKSKAEIEERYGIARFNELCRESVLRYIDEWNAFSERMAFFVDLDDPYFTMDSDYIDSVWSLLKVIWEKGLIYQGYKVVPCDPVLGATMSDAEVDQGYRETSDPSLTVRFALEADSPFGSNACLLVWTTTPWTLPANTALAIAPQHTYVLLEGLPQPAGDKLGGASQRERLICAKERLSSVFGEDHTKEYTVLRTFKGQELVGLKYTRLFTFLESVPEDKDKMGWYVLGADFVNMDSGTGIVHIAPAYGADDLALCQKHQLPLLHGVGLDGKFIEHTPYAGLFFKEADKPIIKELKERRLVWRSERYTHKYPFGYRTGAPLLYYAKNAWYIRTTAIKEQLTQNNETIRWIPEHIQHGRFGKWLENNRDWALSRERYWGTPLPIWTDGAGAFTLVASRQELSALSGRDLSSLELHRPNVDEIEFKDTSGRTMRRVPEVMDCWFDSGAMPYAQQPAACKERALPKPHYFPADFISEAVDQTRGWFYTLLAISSMVSERSPYKNVICLGHVVDEKGEKMSKSKGNVVDPWSVFETHGADAIRWYFLTGAPPGNSRRVGQPGSANDPVSIAHAFLNMLRNSVGFFTLYANIDGIAIAKDWEHTPIEGAPPFARRPDMDRWLLSLLQDLIHEVDLKLKSYDCLGAGKLIEGFLDSLSNWYIRRNRRRFWKGALDEDKLSAYDSLYRCLTVLSRIVAPFIPFAAEEAFQALVVKPLSQAKAAKACPESVILAGWPQALHKEYYDPETLKEGELIKEAVFLGRAARMQSGLKVRQPLARMFLYLEQSQNKAIITKNQNILLEELNVKALEFLDDSAGILDYRIKPNLPRIGKRLGQQVRRVQQYLQNADPRETLALFKKQNKLSIPLSESQDQSSIDQAQHSIHTNGNNAIELEKEDLLIESVSKAGTAGVEGKGMLLALETHLSPELIIEGLARDLVRHIQELRKVSGFAVIDRIGLYFHYPSERLRQVLHAFSEHIETETLGKISQSKPSLLRDQKVFQKKLSIENEEIEVSIWQAKASAKPSVKKPAQKAKARKKTAKTN